MSVSAFREWARSENIEANGSTDQLADATIAIDADEYLHTLLTAPSTREPLLPALGGLPFALQKHVDRDLQQFQEAKITPIFVFNGLEIAARDRSIISREARKSSRNLNDAWTTYDEGRGEPAVVQFGKACFYRVYHISRWLQTYLRQQGVSVQVALFTAAAQITYLLDNKDVHAVYGSANCLLFGAGKVVTHLDWEEKRFHWVELSQCLGKLMLDKDQFTDLMLISGCSILPPLGDIDSDSPSTRVTAARGLLSTANQNGHTVCVNAKDESYLEAFHKARNAIKYPVRLNEDGAISQQNVASAPSDLHFCTGQRLPDELFYYLFLGIAGPRVLSHRTRNEVYETQPLDGGSSSAYRDFVQEKLRPLRSQSLALLTRLLHKYYQHTDIDLICWFKEDDKRTLNIRELTEDSSANAHTWHLLMSDFPNKSSLDILKSPVTFAIKSLAEEEHAKRTVKARISGKAGNIAQPQELLGNTTWRFLHDRGYVNPDHTLSAWGKALKTALSQAASTGYLDPNNTEHAEESIFLAFELLRLDMLNSKTLFLPPTYSGAPLRGSETDKAYTLLISRVATLGSFKHKSIGYTGPLSRHLLAYHQIASTLRAALRDLVEVHACNMLLSGDVPRDLKPKELANFGATLPFLQESDLGLSLVVKSYLDELSTEPAKRPDVSKWFNHALDIPGDLKRAWSLWGAINAGVQTADSSIITNETRKLFKTADDWLQQKLGSKTESTA